MGKKIKWGRREEEGKREEGKGKREGKREVKEKRIGIKLKNGRVAKKIMWQFYTPLVTRKENIDGVSIRNV